MSTPVDLQKFCAKADSRSYLNAPWRFSSGAGASDGAIIILVDNDSDDYPDTPQIIVDAIKRSAGKNSGTWIDLSNIQIPDPVKCPDCNGSGNKTVYECDECDGEGVFKHGSNKYECKECKGTGEVAHSFGTGKQVPCASCKGSGEMYQPVLLGNETYAQAKYLRRLSELPGCQISPNDCDVMAFVFDGGRGWLMPCGKSKE